MNKQERIANLRLAMYYLNKDIQKYYLQGKNKEAGKFKSYKGIVKAKLEELTGKKSWWSN